MSPDPDLPRTRFRDGRTGELFWFAVLVGFYLIGVGLFALQKVEAVGQPDVGWNLDWHQVAPTRIDSAEAGLRGGGRALEINGRTLGSRSVRNDVVQGYRRELGATNTLTLRRPSGAIETHDVPVRALSWADVFYTDGASLLLGALFFGVGLLTFLLRPYQQATWALLALGCLAGGFLTTVKLEANAPILRNALYYRTTLGFLASVPLHAMLAYPVVHAWLRRGSKPLIAIYGLGIAHAAVQITAWRVEWAGLFRYVGIFDTSLMLTALALFVVRCGMLSMRATDPLAAQRARILLSGSVVGAGIPVFVRFMQTSFGMLVIDTRITYWALAILLWALARTALRQELMDARVAVQRAVIYGITVVALTLVAIAMVSITPYLMALLLLPLLYLWPSFVEYLDTRLYPKRLQLAALVRELNERMVRADSVEQVVALLALAPGELADASRGIAVLFAGPHAPKEIGRTSSGGAPDGGPLADEPLVRLVTAMRKPVFRHQLRLEPLFENVIAPGERLLARLGIEGLVPVLNGDSVVGLLGLGARTTGDPYGPTTLEVLTTISQQGLQAISRIHANERLVLREREFSELTRFFSPQVIDRVMEAGGTAELRSQRKPVTVLFADLRGFTSFAERVEPEEVMRTLAEFHERMGARINEYEGTLERFVGDGFMVFFNDPVEQPDHVERAVRMALAMLDDMAELREAWARRGHDIDVGVGIATGYATVGFIGYEGRRDYGVIGTVTNLAARLSDAAGAGEILVSAPVRAELRSNHLLESAGRLDLAGFQQPQAAFRLLAPASDLPQ